MRSSLRSFVLFSAFLCLTTLGCGPRTENTCTDVACERGVCQDGQCVNAPACSAPEDCLEGHTCTADGCAPEYPCAQDGDCARGVCVSSACVNAPSCTATSDCLPDHACQAGTCVSDRCAEVTCERGVCAAGTGACVNSEICSEATELQDCIEGYLCYGQTCQSREEICRAIDCSRGVCDPERKGCVDASDCLDETGAPSDRLCVEGNFCAEDGTCQPNLCDAEMTSCPRGVCDRTSAECVNAEPCAAADECTDGFSCVEGTCVTSGDECGDAGCPGNQICAYDADALRGVCAENEQGCRRALDCTGVRVCVEGACAEPAACVADAHEPSGTSADPIRIAEHDHMISASLCPSDTDVFALHTSESELFRGKLYVELRYEPADVGVGDLDLQLAHEGSVVATATGVDAHGRIRLEHDVTAVNQGEYIITVSDAGVTTAGVRYTLFADLVDETVIAACEQPRELVDISVTGNSSAGSSHQLGSSCTSADNPAGEDVYRFELTEPAYVTLAVTPTSGADMALSVGTSCVAPGAEVACVNDVPADGTERIARRFEPGEYYVVVQGAGEGSGGEYTLGFLTRTIVCDSGDDTCVDDTTSRYCNARGTAFETETCAMGCDAALGRCARAVSDVCYTAIDASGGYTGAIAWASLTNDYEPGPAGCVPDSSGTQTDGPDAAFYVELQPGELVHARLDRDYPDAASMYLVSACDDMSSCVMGVNAGTSNDEELVYTNETDRAQSLYLIADVQSHTSYGTSVIEIGVYPTVCVPGSSSCHGTNELETCNRLGTGYDTAYCSAGCAQGACAPVVNDVCASALDLLAATSITGRIDEYGGDYNPGFAGCTGSSATGPDAVYFVETTQPQTVTVDLSADFDAALWVVSDCQSASQTCLAGSGESPNESVEFYAEPGQTYYVIVDSDSFDTGMFTISATTQAPLCTPGTGPCAGSTLERCNEAGTAYDPYHCTFGCDLDTCMPVENDTCSGAVDILAEGSFVGRIDEYAGDYDPGSGGCSQSSASGSDAVFLVQAPDSVVVTLDLTADFDANLWVMTDCSDAANTCLLGSGESGSEQVRFQTSPGQAYYVVVDSDPGDTGMFTLTASAQIPSCIPGEHLSCWDANTMEYCGALSVPEQYTCSTTCTAARCDDPTGDVCADAISVTDGNTVSGTYSGTNDSNPEGVVGGCDFSGSSEEPEGVDHFYRVELLAGQTLSASFTTTSAFGTMYLMRNCLDVSTCIDNTTRGGSGSLQYTATQDETIFIVMDRTLSGSSSSYNYDVSVTIN